ncbi:carbon-nitrogen hydrolase family protein [Rhodocaloribacter litoris]|uniref:carbon-nitrogen hydrolase family protein n=1 Tax=Rhodocaloribacter litoris TaxID=2558931 RepID=UPI0014224705|nr:carbon-nitrogen hydrolase family protein [Rhodocaloribacter litoris]QXD14846.1 carbon-nitrogen hydrolase family protein [Rhodocaloribacter litoris]GIV59058.1 MAG: amidohydrolase [Rhodothermaceae bacterium]
MDRRLTLACIQHSAGADLDANLKETTARVREAAGRGARLVGLPEYFSQLHLHRGRLQLTAYDEADHPALPVFRALASELGIWILLGSLPVSAPDGRAFNRSLLLDDAGRIAARYDKIHLFDVDLGRGEAYRESGVIMPGSRAVVAETPWGRLGLSVCYDLRFPHLYRRLAQAGAEILAVPSAFTRTTGQAHWHVLLRARAIENGAYVFAPAQCGTHGDGATYGHALIVDPWGRVLADAGDTPGLILAEIDLDEVARVRARIPSLRHDRPFDLAS